MDDGYTQTKKHIDEDGHGETLVGLDESIGGYRLLHYLR